MARPTRSDMQKYENVLTEVGERLRLVRQLLDEPVVQAEWIAVELRIALELIVLGSLVTNRNAIARVSSVFKVKEVGGARNLVREVNPDYWPRPIESGSRDDDGALTAHPYSDPRDRASDVERLRALFFRTAILLRQHAIVLAGNRDASLGQLDVDGGEVLVAILRRPDN